MSTLYPIFLNLDSKKVLVVGAGEVALRKIQDLLDAGAIVQVVAPSVHPGILALSSTGRLFVALRDYCQEDLHGMWIVIAATDARSVNECIAQHAETLHIFCNVVDQPDLCSFQVPSAFRQGLLQMAISTGGASPALAKKIRKELEETYGPVYARLLEALSELRARVKLDHPEDPEKRHAILSSFLESEAVAEYLRLGHEESLRKALDTWNSRS